MIDGVIEAGREYASGALVVRVIRVHPHAGTVKVWYRRADGKDITHWLSESWQYEADFRMKFTAK